MMKIKGFDEDLKCRGYQFEIGKTYEIKLPDGYELTKEDLCSDKVFHYCNSLRKVHGYYSVEPEENNRFCEIEVLGREVTDGDKCGSNKIKIIREIAEKELDVLRGLINGNTGFFNSGDHNSGNCNSGDCNSGGRNSGNCNSGNCNSGDHNSGYCNSGNCNSGDHNSGYFNSCDYSSGLFCTQYPKVKIFDTETDMTMKEVMQTDWYRMLFKYSINLTKWIEYTDEEKQFDKDKDLIGGYLKTYTYKEACKNWWNEYTDKEKAVIMSMPNFDKDKFKQITGIEVE
ncbi:MAG: pentapeptide repeat-containing protein [Eubacteriales bacterium]|nr:pentapeptide repeat-containing protein [Eubacteriales bacterium]